MKVNTILFGAVVAFSGSAFADSVSVDTDSTETLGMSIVEKSALTNKEAVLNIPYVKSTGASIGAENTVDTLLVAGFDEDDTIRVWNAQEAVGSEYDTWYWEDAWKASNKSKGTKPGPASETTVVRGNAFWFKDYSKSTIALVQAGLVKTGAVTTVTAGTKGSPRSTLLINPYGVEIDAAEKLATGAVTGDQISLVNGTVRYDYKAGSGWGLWQKGEIIVKKGDLIIYGPDKFVTTNITVAAGTAFWYISKGGSPTVQW